MIHRLDGSKGENIYSALCIENAGIVTMPAQSQYHNEAHLFERIFLYKNSSVINIFSYPSYCESVGFSDTMFATHMDTKSDCCNSADHNHSFYFIILLL